MGDPTDHDRALARAAYDRYLADHQDIDDAALLDVWAQSIHDARGIGRRSAEATLSAAVSALGGTVAGLPTSRLNFLQRIQELREKEAALDRLMAEGYEKQEADSGHIKAGCRVIHSEGFEGCPRTEPHTLWECSYFGKGIQP